MSKLILTRADVEKAVKQYYQDYETELYRKYDFKNIDMYVDKERRNYLGAEFVIEEKTAK